jgi:PTH1 family peptidyl-tRNA hydrolase
MGNPAPWRGVKLVVGLGNPGREYARTRHNVGFEVVEGLASRHQATWTRKPDAEIARWGQDAVLIKPQTYMNLSGSAVQHWQHFYRVAIEDVLVVVDDVNLEAGRLRIRRSGSAGGHNGLKSIVAALGTDQFGRLRVGVGGGDRKNLSSHVLGRFSADEEAIIEAAIARAVEAIEVFVADGIVAAMNGFNRKDDKAEDGRHESADN